MKKVLHVVPGLDEPWNGIAGAAKDIARSQGADIVDTLQFLSSSSHSNSELQLSSYDEIWVHSNWWLPTIRACRKVLKAGVPLVRMTHANLDPLRLRSKGWKKLPMWRLVERRLTNRSARVVVTCEAEREWCERAGVTAPFELLDLKKFFRLEGRGKAVEDMSLSLPLRLRTPTQLHVLYLGRQHPLKGVEFLAQAIKELSSDLHPDSTPPAPRFALRIVSNHSGGELESDWAWADVLCLPTLSDNFGLVVAEALERGKRVITTDGAPAWGEGLELRVGSGGVEELRVESGGVKSVGVGSEIWSGYGGQLIYLKGYRDGTDEERVELLKMAIERICK